MAVKKKATRKAPAKKAAAKKAVKKAVRKTAVKKTATKKAVKQAATKVKAITTKQTKTQIVAAIAEETGLPKKDVSAVFGSLSGLITAHMTKRGSGEFTIPDTGVKIRRIKKPATKARKMISPFSGEEITVKAKPARNVIKVSALKSLKDAV